MNELHGYLYSKEKLQTGSLYIKREREREHWLKEVLRLKRAKKCAHLKQAMTMPAWSMPSSYWFISISHKQTENKQTKKEMKKR